MGTRWTPEADAKLTELWLSGQYSTQHIAGMLGIGVTKNAVIGRAHRLGLAPKIRGPHAPMAPAAPSAPRATEAARVEPAPEPAPILKPPPAPIREPARAVEAAPPPRAHETAPRSRRPPAPAPEPPKPVAIAIAARRAEQCEAAGVTIFDLDDFACRFIPGAVDGANTLYCGAAKAIGSPYCNHHANLARGAGTPTERRATDLKPALNRTGAWA